MKRVSISKRLKGVLKVFSELKAMAAEAKSAENKHKTISKNVLRDELQANDAPYGSFVRIDGVDYKYATTEGYVINPEDLYELINQEDNDYELKDFFECCKINLASVKKRFGGDTEEALRQKVSGDELDIRMSKVSVDDDQTEGLYIADTPKIKSTRKLKRKAEKQAVPSRRTRRRIKTKR